MGRHRRYAIGATLALSVETSFEVARIIVNRPWNGITPAFSHGVSAALAVLCFAAAVVMPARRVNLDTDSVRWVLGVCTLLGLSVHTAFTLWLHDSFAVVPLMCAVVTGICFKRTFDAGELALGRPTEMAGPSIPPGLSPGLAAGGLSPDYALRAIRSH